MKKIHDMIQQQVGCKTEKSLMSPNCKCVKYKWVFKIKCNGIYQASLVTSHPEYYY